MSDTKRFDLPAEDKDRVMRLTQEVFVPHLQKAVEEARAQAPFTEVISAASSAYADLLDMTVGREAAIALLKGLADHMEKRPASPPSGHTKQ